MYRYQTIGVAALCIAALACERGSEVQEETADLQAAQKDVGRVTQELEKELQEAKANVVRLEEKLAMARQGITDEVLSERRELEQSLKEQQGRVETEINEAKREAQVLSRDSEQAARHLEQTQPPARVEAEVRTETQVVEQQRTPVQTTERQEIIPVRGTTTPDAGTRGEIDLDVTEPAAPR